jgi:hypothetical protein
MKYLKRHPEAWVWIIGITVIIIFVAIWQHYTGTPFNAQTWRDLFRK